MNYPITEGLLQFYLFNFWLSCLNRLFLRFLNSKYPEVNIIASALNFTPDDEYVGFAKRIFARTSIEFAQVIAFDGKNNFKNSIVNTYII